MKTWFWPVLIILPHFLVGDLSAQDNYSLNKDSTKTKEEPRELIFKPTIGLGTGMFSFYGDISDKTLNHALVNRIGYDLTVGKSLTPFLDINFYILFGTLGTNERSQERNLNFQSEIRTGGVYLSYNFDHLLKKERKIEPFVSIGIESFEFLSKTDLYDGKGNKYYYWNNGSIRNIDENEPNASSAIILQRDYTYETDIRESNFDGFGKYTERSFAMPVGAGINMHLTDKIDFKIGAHMHYTFTDLVDGVSAESIGDRAGNSKNDKFLMTSFSLSYDFMITKKYKSELKEEDFKDVDFLALDMSDSDGDGVRDFIDNCAGTPPDITVDNFGCPLDDDKDVVPNHKDEELATPPDVFVTTEGVHLTDSLILQMYLAYMDSTGRYAKISKTKSESEITKVQPLKYRIQLGAYTTGISPDLINKFLSIPDITSTTINDSVTIYATGNYSDRAEAEKRKNDLVISGIPTATVVIYKNGKFIPAGDESFISDATTGITETTATKIATIEESVKKEVIGETIKKETTGGITTEAVTKKETPAIETATGVTTQKEIITGETPINNSFTGDPVNTVVFRIQLGAYSKKLSSNVFNGVDDLIVIPAENGLIKYLAGSFTDFTEAAKYKVDMLLKGYNGAFIIAYKNGKRVPLETVGATRAAPENIEETNKTSNAINKDLIKFKVQIGAFKNEVPPEIREKFNAIQNIEKQATLSGLTRYSVGSFTDFDKAATFKNEIINKFGITDAFVVAFFKDQVIPVQEALELIKQ